MSSVRTVEPRSVTWKNRSSDVAPEVLGVGGAHVLAICAPFYGARSAPWRWCAWVQRFGEGVRSIRMTDFRRNKRLEPSCLAEGRGGGARGAPSLPAGSLLRR